jgi:hypothetical protein
MISRALWHRHWVDSVGGLIVAVPITLLLCVRFLWYFLSSFHLPAYVEGYRNSLSPLFWPETALPFAAESDPQRLLVWETHASVTIWLCVGLLLFIWGSGIRSNNLWPGHASIHFNLTLPVSRARLVLTRYLMSALCALVLMLILLLSNSLVTMLYGFPVPFTEMAQTTAMGVLFLCACLAVLCCFGTINENLLGWLVIGGGIFLAAIAGDWIAEFVVAFPFAIERAGVLVAIIFASLAGAIVAAHRLDF